MPAHDQCLPKRREVVVPRTRNLSQIWQHIPAFTVHFGKASCYQLSFGQPLEYHRYLTRGSCWGYGQWIYFTTVEVQIIPAAVFNYMYWCWLERDKRARRRVIGSSA